MTRPKSDRRLSSEEFRKKMAEHGVERMSDEERKSGVWSLTFITSKANPRSDEEESGPPR